MNDTIAVPVRDPSAVGQARRTVTKLAGGVGFGEERVGEAALVATELAQNLQLHARDGVLFMRALREGLELLSVDRGPGMADVDACLRDGYSTVGTAGKGLGAIARKAHLFDVQSDPGRGTVVLAQLFRDGAPPREEGPTVGVVCLPREGEEVAGDGWAVRADRGITRLLVVDGLGHGLPAFEAAREAVESFEAHPGWAATELVPVMHERLRSTRGAAVGIAEVSLEPPRVSFVGVGNVAGAVLIDHHTHRLVSLNGTVGHALTRVQAFDAAWGRDGILVVHSDGLSSGWRLETYPGLRMRHPSVIAGVLWRDFTRGRDDVVVLVARCVDGRTE